MSYPQALVIQRNLPPEKVESRHLVATRLSEGLREIQGFDLPFVEKMNTHPYNVNGKKSIEKIFPIEIEFQTN